jgi:hypothetical protein
MVPMVDNYRKIPRRKKITTRPYKSAERPLGRSEKCDEVPGLDPALDPRKSTSRKPPCCSGEPGRRKHNGEAQKQTRGPPYSHGFRRGDGSSCTQVAGENSQEGRRGTILLHQTSTTPVARRSKEEGESLSDMYCAGPMRH